MSDNGGNSSREKTTQWLEHVLQTYYTYLERKTRTRTTQGSSSAVPGETNNDLVSVNVIDFDIGPGFSGDGRISTLSDLLALRVKFTLNGSAEEKTENWIVKIPPNDKADREMAQMAQVDKREIHFYTEALPELEEWYKGRDASLRVGVPQCYFAKYHNTEPQVEGDDGSTFSDAESVLVLEDMRPNGYSMRDFNSGLSLAEAYAALREIATIHALSWAMQETLDVALDDKWEFAYRPQKAASAYKIMIEQGFPTLAEFLERQQPDGPEILAKLKALKPKASELLCELLEAPPPPAPACLTHMDFWCNNLLFRKPLAPDGTASNSQNGSVINGNGLHASGDEDVDLNTTECLIVDWQMMAISRPTHDVALLLFTSLSPEVRRANTDALLRHYWNVFQSTAAKVKVEVPFGFEVIENEFKKSQLLALLLVITEIDLAVGHDLELERRLMQALRDMAREDLI